MNVCKAIREIKEEGIQEGIQKGIQREQKLFECLLSDARLEDMKRSFNDAEFREQLLREYKIDRM